MQAIISPHKYLKYGILALATLLFVVIGVFTMRPVRALSANGQHIITVHDDGVDKGFVTSASTIRDALKDGGIRLDARDRTEPGLNEQLVATSYQVNIYRARPVLVRDGASELTIVTSYRTGQQIAAEAGTTLQDEDMTALTASTDPISDGAVEVLTITRATPFTFVFYGKTELAYSQAKTVGEMLKEKGIKMTLDDELSLSTSTPLVLGMTIALWRNGVQTVTLDEDIAFSVTLVKDANRQRGYKEVTTVGVAGQKTVTYKINIQNGLEISREALNSVITKPAVTQIEVVGTKGLYTTPSENESITWDFLTDKGLTREQAAGIMGNLMQEHKFNTSGDGLAQWSGSRKAALMSLPNPDSIYTQLDFLWMELSGSYIKALNSIRDSTTVEGAVIAFQNQYERCGYCREDLRIQYAYNILASH